jgi:hypothetical protein
MSILTMNMSGYEIEHDDGENSAYGDEVMCAGWIPTLAPCESRPEHVEMPASLATVDAEIFLRKMYACQR